MSIPVEEPFGYRYWMVTWDDEAHPYADSPRVTWTAHGIRFPDYMCFVVQSIVSKEHARSELDVWLTAPLKPFEQSEDEYIKSEAYRDFVS